MGLSSKRSRKAVDLEDFDDSEDEELMLREEDEVDDEEDIEEENEEEEEDSAEEGEEDSGEEEEDRDEDDGEMEELVKEYKNLHNQEQDILRNLKHLKDEDVLKGQAGKNQKVLSQFK